MRAGDAPQAIANLEQAMAHARKLGQPVNGLYDALNLASAYIVAGRYDDARALAMESLARPPAASGAGRPARSTLLADAMWHAFLSAGLSACAAEACLRLQQLDEAERLATASLRQEEEVHRPYALTTLGSVADARGQHAQADKLLEEAVASAQAAQDRYAEMYAWMALADVHRASEQIAAERDALTQALALAEALGLTVEARRVGERLAS